MTIPLNKYQIHEQKFLKINENTNIEHLHMVQLQKISDVIPAYRFPQVCHAVEGYYTTCKLIIYPDTLIIYTFCIQWRRTSAFLIYLYKINTVTVWDMKFEICSIYFHEGKTKEPEFFPEHQAPESVHHCLSYTFQKEH